LAKPLAATCVGLCLLFNRLDDTGRV